jgi:hypothetical protein
MFVFTLAREIGMVLESTNLRREEYGKSNASRDRFLWPFPIGNISSNER